jgi:hypothetical protein
MSGGHGEKLSRVQERLVAALISQSTIAAAAAEAGISVSSARRYLRIKSVRVAFQQARQALLDEAVNLLHKSTTHAITTLLVNLRAAEPSIQCRAAIALVDFSFRASQWADLETEIAELREAVEVLQANQEDDP